MNNSKKDQGSVELISLESLLSGDDRNPIGIVSEKEDEIVPPLKEEGDEKKDDDVTLIALEDIDNESSLKDKKENADDADEGGETKGSEKQAIAPTETSEQYRQTLKNVFGITKFTEEDEDGNEVEVSIDEIEMDGETFQKLVEQELAYQKEEANKGKISIEGVSDYTKKLIEIEQKGGDTLKLLQVKEAYSDPLANLDLTTKQGQVDAIYLRKKAQGATDKEINILIKGLEAEGILEEEAIQAESELKALIDQQFENERIKAEKVALEREETMKKFKKDFRDKLSEKFTLNDNVKSKLVTSLTKKGEDGKYQLDNAYLAAMSDPETATELVLFLSDREEFLKQVTAKAVQKTQLESAKKLKIIRSANGGTGTNDPVKTGKLIPLDNL
jgi:hypothetical protein